MKEELLKRRCKDFLILPMALFFAILACAPGEAPAPQTKIQEKPESPAIKAEASWEQQWEDLLKAAKKEGRISMYSGLESSSIDALREHFGKKYGIKMEIVTGQTRALNVKLFAERQAGLYVPDVYIEGPTSPLREWKPRGMLTRLDGIIFRPDILDEKVWWSWFGTYFDKDHYLAGGQRGPSLPVFINTQMVRPEELTSYNDLLEPRWKGKIIMANPNIVGSGANALVAALRIMGEEYIKKLADQVGILVDDKKQVAEWLARGKYPIGFGAGSIWQQYAEAGAPLDSLQFKEGHNVSATGVIVLFDPAPNPNTAKFFINWFLSREGQQVYSVASGKLSRRLDVTEDHLPPSERLKEGIKYIINDEDYYLKEPEYIAIVNKYYLKR